MGKSVTVSLRSYIFISLSLDIYFLLLSSENDASDLPAYIKKHCRYLSKKLFGVTVPYKKVKKKKAKAFLNHVLVVQLYETM